MDPHGYFSVAVDRVMGNDPTQAFEGPAFWRFALKVQPTKPQKNSIYRALAATRALHII